MTYNWGKYEECVVRIENGRFLDGCDSHIMHASFNMGQNPNGFIFYNKTINQTQALIASENVNYGDLPLVTRLFCGATLPNDINSPNGIMLQTFNVLDVDLFDKL